MVICILFKYAGKFSYNYLKYILDVANVIPGLGYLHITIIKLRRGLYVQNQIKSYFPVDMMQYSDNRDSVIS